MTNRKTKRKKVRTPKPTRSFDQMVADATVAKFGPFVAEQVARFGNEWAARQAEAIKTLHIRYNVLEDIVSELTPGATEELFVERYVAGEDAFDGFEPKPEGPVEVNNRIRFELQHQKVGDVEFTPIKHFVVTWVGSGKTFGKIIEDALVGMSVGEEKQFTVEDGTKVRLKVNRISRAITPPTAAMSQSPVEPVVITPPSADTGYVPAPE